MELDFGIDKKALLFASKKHKYQTFNDNSGTPYIEHCKRVYCNLFTYMGDDYENRDVLAAVALLHDTLEDTETTYEEIKEQFGEEIANNVLALTKDEKLAPEKQMEDSLKRINATSREAKMVKMADRITNITTLHPLWGYKSSVNYLNESKMILKYLGDAHEGLAEELKKRINKYENAINIKLIEGGFMKYFTLNENLYAYDENSGLTLSHDESGWTISNMTLIQLLHENGTNEISKEEAKMITEEDPIEAIDFYNEMLK